MATESSILPLSNFTFSIPGAYHAYPHSPRRQRHKHLPDLSATKARGANKIPPFPRLLSSAPSSERQHTSDQTWEVESPYSVGCLAGMRRPCGCAFPGQVAAGGVYLDRHTGASGNSGASRVASCVAFRAFFMLFRGDRTRKT